MRNLSCLNTVFFAFALFLLSSTGSDVDPATGASYCLTGAFIGDVPGKTDIEGFEKDYGKKPYIVMVFIDWGRLIEGRVIDDVYSRNCVLMVTWEPWDAVNKKGIGYNKLIAGNYDDYIRQFAGQLRRIKKPVYLRFAHEMNGNWYPWSGVEIGKDAYTNMYRRVKDIFDKEKADNVRWVFSVNWEDVPKEDNHFTAYYPGDGYVDYVGIDGYNWGTTQNWSHWISFRRIFNKVYEEVISTYQKPVLISEFGCASKGGNKARWIKHAMENIKDMPGVKGFVLFNRDKEANWEFQPGEPAGKELKRQLRDKYFKDSRPN